MAMYYQGSSEIQADGLQTLYLMNPNYIGYTDTQQQQQPASMFLLNSAAAGNLPHAPIPSQAHTQHFVGVPLPASLHDPSRASSVHEVSGAGLLQRLWSSADQNSDGAGGGETGSQSHIPSSTVVSPSSGMGPTTDFTSQLGFQRPGLVLSPMQHQHQGLSLSLSPQQQQQQQQRMNFRSIPLDHHEISPHENHQAGLLSSPSPRTNNDSIRASGASSSFSFSNGMILGSKYLKAAQELLDEVVNVGKGIKLADRLEGKEKQKLENNNELMTGLDSEVGVPTSGSGESSSQKNSVVELTTAQRQELQMKKAKLVSMLDEVEQRYRQYHHQMQIIVASFEQAAGIGSAKSYTQLALHTISKQFRCLKDAISGQIKATSKSLGEEESLGGKIEGSSRLKFVDHHLRQQRALQQLGMIQPNAWRPQRGLPERAVSVLRAWLFEHFLHPYPKDSDKIMLAKQTGLTRSQVSNWFINARVRLWKPMVEEMYNEEVKNNQNAEQNGIEENIKKNEPHKEVSPPQETSKLRKDKQLRSSNIIMQQDTSPTEISTSTLSTSPTGGSLPAQAPGFSFIGSLNMDSTAERNNKKPRNHDMHNSSSSILSMDTDQMKGIGSREITNKGGKFNGDGDDRQPRDQSYPLMAAYTNMAEFGRFHPQQLATSFQGNGVSLTLGLPPNAENLALSATSHNFLPNQNVGLGRMESHYNNPQAPSHPNITYETIDFQSGKRYAAQLLPDFVS